MRKLQKPRRLWMGRIKTTFLSKSGRWMAQSDQWPAYIGFGRNEKQAKYSLLYEISLKEGIRTAEMV